MTKQTRDRLNRMDAETDRTWRRIEARMKEMNSPGYRERVIAAWQRTPEGRAWEKRLAKPTRLDLMEKRISALEAKLLKLKKAV